MPWWNERKHKQSNNCQLFLPIIIYCTLLFCFIFPILLNCIFYIQTQGKFLMINTLLSDRTRNTQVFLTRNTMFVLIDHLTSEQHRETSYVLNSRPHNPFQPLWSLTYHLIFCTPQFPQS
jgi:hypothetical protein